MDKLFSMNAIARAVRLLLAGSVLLIKDAEASPDAELSQVTVGSNLLFDAGDEVLLSDELGHEAAAVVAEKSSLTTVRFEEPLADGPFLMKDGAMLSLAKPPIPDLKKISQGPPVVLDQRQREDYPRIAVHPVGLKQPWPLKSADTRLCRTYQQDYELVIYYVDWLRASWEAANQRVVQRAGLVFNTLMADPYLGGMCWASQVTEVDLDAHMLGETGLRLRGAGEMYLHLVAFTLTAKRAAVRGPASIARLKQVTPPLTSSS